MADRVYFEEYVRILVFYLYFTKDNAIIDQLIRNTEQIYGTVEPGDFEADAAFINRLYMETPKPLTLPSTAVERNREELRKQLDELDDRTTIEEVSV